MSTEVFRNQIAMTDKGQVVVIEKQSYDDYGSNLVSTFEVRHGVRTIGEYGTVEAANDVAYAVAGVARPKAEKAAVVEPEPEPVKAKKGK